MASLPNEHLDLRVEVPRPEVVRLLGYPRGRQPSDAIKRALDELWPRASALLQPRGAFSLVSSHQAAAAGMPRPSSTVGIGVCTIGPALEQEAQRLAQQEDVLGALLLDSFGSAAAEATAIALDRRLCGEARAAGLRSERRISPGYGRWEVRFQRELLALLPIAAVGIRLTPGMMMMPRKSVSFGIRFGSGPGVGERDRRRCVTCELETCSFRDDASSDAGKRLD